MTTWNGSVGDGSWETAGNWSGNAVPGSGDTVDITNALSGKYVVSMTADDAVDTVNIGNANAELFISNANLTANTVNLTAGTLFLNSGTITGATIVNSSGSILRSADGILDNVTWDGTLSLDGPQSSSFDNLLQVSNLQMAAGSALDITGYNAELDIADTMTLSMSGAVLPIVIGGAGHSNYIKVLNGSTLTLEGTLVSDAKNAHVFLEDDGNGGTIDNIGSMTFGDPLLKPAGTVEIQPSNFNNEDLIKVNSQTIDFTSNGVFNGTSNVGGFTNGSLGNIFVNAGTMTVHDNGTVFVNNGNISLSNKSHLTFYSNANNTTGDGVITLSGNSWADIGNYSGAVDFDYSSAPDRLWLESVSKFKGQIQDFAIGDTIDFRSVAYAFGDYATFVKAALGGTVSIHNAAGAVVASFVIVNTNAPANINASDFTLNQDSSLDLVVGLTNHVVHDFNGDGISDVLFVNPATRQIADWQMANTGKYSGLQHIVTAPVGWSVVGNGDFNNDGISDILLQNSTTHALDIWKGSASGFSGSPTAVGGTAPASTWRVAGVGNFYGAGAADVVWQNGTAGAAMIWKVVNDKYVSSVNVAVPASNAKIVGTGDFNGDGFTDILWQSNASTHYLWDQQIVNGHVQSTHFQSPPTGWTYVGVGDFKGNGTDEALLESSTGALRALNMVTGSAFNLGNPLVPSGFSVAAIGDYNGDGVSDVMLYNKSTGVFDVGLASTAGHISSWLTAGTQAGHASWNFAA